MAATEAYLKHIVTVARAEAATAGMAATVVVTAVLAAVVTARAAVIPHKDIITVP